MRIAYFVIVISFLLSCSENKINTVTSIGGLDSLTTATDSVNVGQTGTEKAQYSKIMENIRIKDYFPFMDNLVMKLDTFPDRHLTEHILVHANPWILDSLIATDYYQQKADGKFLYNQADYIILHKDDSLLVPDSSATASLHKKLNSIRIDVNVPEFKLRLLQDNDTLFTTTVRVGRNTTKYLALAGRKVDLRTPIGSGEVVRIARIPYFIDPETGKRYDSTRRDDYRYTKMPIIPWIEPSINGIRYGTLIHPTTNPRTLGKAVSNGCIGTTEAAGWVIYYHAPVGTKVTFRYDRKVVNEQGDSIVLNDIYKRDSNK